MTDIEGIWVEKGKALREDLIPFKNPYNPQQPEQVSTSEFIPEIPPEPDDKSMTERISRAITSGPEAEAALAFKVARAREINQTHAGLSKLQRKFLYNRALCGSDREATRAINMSITTLYNWQKEDAVFMRAYAALWVDPVLFTQNTLINLLPKATEVIEEVLESGSTREKLKAAELAFRSQGILKGDGEEEVNEYERRITEQLRERGINLTPRLKQLKPVDGEFSVISTNVVKPDLTDLTDDGTLPVE